MMRHIITHLRRRGLIAAMSGVGVVSENSLDFTDPANSQYIALLFEDI